MLACSHLTSDPDSVLAWFTGRGVDHFLVCPACAANYPTPPEPLVDAPAGVLDALDSPFCFERACGKPSVLQRDCSLRFVHDQFPSPLPHDETLIDIVPDRQTAGLWLCLGASGRLYRANLREAIAAELFHANDPGFPIDAETALLCSADNDFLALVQASGRHGTVYDMATGTATVRLDRGEYRPENSRFPAAFFRSGGRNLLVTGTAWNRLDVFDPANGQVVTARVSTPCQQGEERPAHYLDYYHATLSVSPDNRWIVDNGWVWHPVGIVRSWRLEAWLDENPWESEDGPSVRALATRAYYWDGPTCWIGDSTIAIWGWGTDDEWLIPAVRIFDVSTGRETRWFAGPEVRDATAWPPKKTPPSLFFDRHLFSVRDESGIAVWDIATGERLLHDPSFAPIQYHPVSREFLAVMPDGFQLSRLDGSADAS